MLFCTSYAIRFACFAVISFLYINKSVCFNFIYELVEQKHIPTMLMVFVSYDCLSYGIICVAYLTLSRDWMPPFACYAVLGAICLLS